MEFLCHVWVIYVCTKRITKTVLASYQERTRYDYCIRTVQQTLRIVKLLYQVSSIADQSGHDEVTRD